MPTAEIITIGTELLLGEIQDTNTRYLARLFREAGIDLYRTTIVGDNPNRIAQAIQEAMRRSEIILTTGGLGPTIDDPTREAVAQAYNVPTEYHPELWVQIQNRFQRYGRVATENNKRQAYLPQGGRAIENPVGTAPGFIMEQDGCVTISLPGVPKEMEYLFEKSVLPYLREHFQLRGTIKTYILHTASVGESQIDEQIGDLETYSNPTIGLSAHPGQIDIRITAKADTVEEADRLLLSIAETIRSRLEEWIYGAESETLEGVIQRNLSKSGLTLATLEVGTNGGLIQRLSRESGPYLGGEISTDIEELSQLRERTEALRQLRQASLALGAALFQTEENHILHLFIASAEDNQEITRAYGGPPQMAPLWAVNVSLDFIRKYIASM